MPLQAAYHVYLECDIKKRVTCATIAKIWGK